MKLFCFASRNQENIWLGVKHRKWAVSTVDAKSMRTRATKARDYMIPGVHGLLYCTPLHALTVPFVVTSAPDLHATVTDIWPTAWAYPFSIRPLGDPRKRVSKESAMAHWPYCIKRQQERGINNITAALNATGVTVFTPNEITLKDWQIILEELAIPSDYPPESD